MSYFLFVFVVLISPPPFKCLCFFPGITFSLTTPEAAYGKAFCVAFFFFFQKMRPLVRWRCRPSCPCHQSSDYLPGRNSTPPKRGDRPSRPSRLRFIFDALTSLAAITEACQKHAKVIWLMTLEMDHPDVCRRLTLGEKKKKKK